MSQELFKYRMFFANDSYNDDPQYEIPVKTIHEQKDAEYRRAYDAQDVDNSDLSVINATNDYSVSIYPWISPLYKEKDGTIVFGKGVVLSESETPQPGPDPDPQPLADGAIYYTTTDNMPLTLHLIGANVSNHTYENGVGKIEFRDCLSNIALGAFANSHTLKTITLPETVTSIGQNAFQDCVELTEVVIPENVTEIGSLCFAKCGNLSSINIPGNVVNIGTSAFIDCANMTSLTIGHGVKGIGDGCFYGCSGLRNVVIPETVTQIGAAAFDGCGEIVFNVKPTTPPTLGENAFGNKNELILIKVNSRLTQTYRDAWPQYYYRINPQGA